MSLMTSVEFDAMETEESKKREAEMLAQRWPMSLDVRSQIIKTALELAGFEMIEPDKYRPIEGPARQKPRIRLAAMRIIASYDRLSIQERKMDLLENPSGEPADEADDDNYEVSPEVAEQALVLLNSATFGSRYRPPARAAAPAPAPEPVPVPAREQLLREPIAWEKRTNMVLAAKAIRQRWPMSREVRGQIILAALGLCGCTVTPQGQVVPLPATDETLDPEGKSEPKPRPKPRTVLAALRVLAAYDRLSLEDRKVELSVRPAEPSKVFSSPIEPDIAAKIHELYEADRRRHQEKQRVAALS
jgi:hypothetical protein